MREELVLSQHKSGALWISSLVSALCFRLLLLNQFHDVLPGSCIQLVVEDALQYYTGEQGVWLAGPSPVGLLSNPGLPGPASASAGIAEISRGAKGLRAIQIY